MNITKSGGQIYLCLMAALALAGCDAAPNEKPHQVYNRYYALVIAGRTFDEDKSYYSKSRQQEVLAKASDRAKKSGTTIEKFMEFYLKFTQRIAECGELTLLSETINGKHAKLVYSRKETCESTPQKDGHELIEMIDEDGWKIISNETRMSG